MVAKVQDSNNIAMPATVPAAYRHRLDTALSAKNTTNTLSTPLKDAQAALDAAKNALALITNSIETLHLAVARETRTARGILSGVNKASSKPKAVVGAVPPKTPAGLDDPSRAAWERANLTPPQRHYARKLRGACLYCGISTHSQESCPELAKKEACGLLPNPVGNATQPCA
ncbi:hypothetical protein T484DRAFT_1756342 [Baffinella frigidus]|nr:hypothetical protein T484DRAFT_1756342 [Cryptophyta sp. CCMP2293]